MAEFNLSAMASRVRYLEQTRDMSREEAEKQVFDGIGLNELNEGVRNEYERLYTNQNSETDFDRNDSERLIDRQNAGTNQQVDTNPTTPTEDTNYEG